MHGRLLRLARELARKAREGEGMARYVTTIRSSLPPEDAFAYMANFENTRSWDPSVREARREGAGEIGPGTAFDLVARFGGRDVPLRYTIVAYEAPRRVVLEAQGRGFISRDTIVVAKTAAGSIIDYDALLEFSGLGRLAEPIMQLVFTRVGARAGAGMARALNE